MNARGAFKPHRRHTVGEPLVRLEPPRVHALGRVTGGLSDIHQNWISGTKKCQRKEDLSLYTDEHGVFVPQHGMPLLAKRFQFVELIGEGQSSVLIKAEDTFRDNEAVSIKILHVSYKILGTQECDVLRELNCKDPGDLAHILRLRTIFSFNEHFCLVIEVLHPRPLYEYFVGEPREALKEAKALSLIRCVANRLLQTLGFLHWQNIIHADLKPENMLLKEEGDFASVKLVDFGNAIHCVYAEVSLYYDDFELQTLLYRAPEVMFGVPFGTAVDLWSLGCILAEFFKGEPIFYGQNREEILEKMVNVLGPFPHDTFKCGKFYPDLWSFTSSASMSRGGANAADAAANNNNNRSQTYTHEHVKDNLRQMLQTTDGVFVDFLAGLLNPDPKERLNPFTAILHPFLAEETPYRFTMSPTYLMELGSNLYDPLLIQQRSYTHAPFIEDELKSQFLTSKDLLKFGTSKLDSLAHAIPFGHHSPSTEADSSVESLYSSSQRQFRNHDEDDDDDDEDDDVNEDAEINDDETDEQAALRIFEALEAKESQMDAEEEELRSAFQQSTNQNRRSYDIVDDSDWSPQLTVMDQSEVVDGKLLLLRDVDISGRHLSIDSSQMILTPSTDQRQSQRHPRSLKHQAFRPPGGESSKLGEGIPASISRSRNKHCPPLVAPFQELTTSSQSSFTAASGSSTNLPGSYSSSSSSSSLLPYPLPPTPSPPPLILDPAYISQSISFPGGAPHPPSLPPFPAESSMGNFSEYPLPPSPVTDEAMEEEEKEVRDVGDDDDIDDDAEDTVVDELTLSDSTSFAVLELSADSSAAFVIHDENKQTNAQSVVVSLEVGTPETMMTTMMTTMTTETRETATTTTKLTTDTRNNDDAEITISKTEDHLHFEKNLSSAVKTAATSNATTSSASAAAIFNKDASDEMKWDNGEIERSFPREKKEKCRRNKNSNRTREEKGEGELLIGKTAITVHDCRQLVKKNDKEAGGEEEEEEKQKQMREKTALYGTVNVDNVQKTSEGGREAGRAAIKHSNRENDKTSSSEEKGPIELTTAKDVERLDTGSAEADPAAAAERMEEVQDENNNMSSSVVIAERNNNNNNNNFVMRKNMMNCVQLHELIDDAASSARSRLWAAKELIRRQGEDVASLRREEVISLRRRRRRKKSTPAKRGDNGGDGGNYGSGGGDCGGGGRQHGRAGGNGRSGGDGGVSGGENKGNQNDEDDADGTREKLELSVDDWKSHGVGVGCRHTDKRRGRIESLLESETSPSFNSNRSNRSNPGKTMGISSGSSNISNISLSSLTLKGNVSVQRHRKDEKREFNFKALIATESGEDEEEEEEEEEEDEGVEVKGFPLKPIKFRGLKSKREQIAAREHVRKDGGQSDNIDHLATHRYVYSAFSIDHAPGHAPGKIHGHAPGQYKDEPMVASSDHATKANAWGKGSLDQRNDMSSPREEPLDSQKHDIAKTTTTKMTTTSTTTTAVNGENQDNNNGQKSMWQRSANDESKAFQAMANEASGARDNLNERARCDSDSGDSGGSSDRGGDSGGSGGRGDGGGNNWAQRNDGRESGDINKGVHAGKIAEGSNIEKRISPTLPAVAVAGTSAGIGIHENGCYVYREPDIVGPKGRVIYGENNDSKKSGCEVGGYEDGGLRNGSYVREDGSRFRKGVSKTDCIPDCIADCVAVDCSDESLENGDRIGKGSKNGIGVLELNGAAFDSAIGVLEPKGAGGKSNRRWFWRFRRQFAPLSRKGAFRLLLFFFFVLALYAVFFF